MPCPNCGSKKRIKFGSAHIESRAELRANASLIISWQEVDRLLSEKEYAAALLVAAVNVEFILWENLWRFSPSVVAKSMPQNVRTTWGKIGKNQSESVTLGSLLRVTEYLCKHDSLAFSPTWDPVACELNEARRKIAHERGYFAKLTQLKDFNWPETRIRQVLEDAKTFCHCNAA